jgi:hypothetical protein
MVTTTATTETRTRRRNRAPWAGVVTALLLVLAAVVVPLVTGWQVHARSDRTTTAGSVAPLHGLWDPRAGPGLVPAIAIAVLGWRYAVDLAERLPWRRLLVVAYIIGLAWLLSLALVDGPVGISRVLGHGYEYLGTARSVHDVPALLDGFVARIPGSSSDNWPPHVAGHPPGALLFFVALVRLGLGGDLAAGLVVTVVAAGTAPAALCTLRWLGAEGAARRAAPFLVLGPAAVFMAVSGDAVFAAVAAWGLAALAYAATRPRTASVVGWSVVAGLVLGCAVMLSYGLVLLGPLALAVLAAARSWRPLPVAAMAALGVVLVFAAYGFAWWEAYPVLRERYWDGLAADRPAAYWMWGNLAALLVAAGPLLGAGVATVAATWRRLDRAVVLLVVAAAFAIVAADLSRMSKAEVERIWLPFVPWLLVSTAALPERWRRPGLALQVATALMVEVLLYTTW